MGTAVSTHREGLGPLQRRMWFLEQLNGPSGLHHIVSVFEVEGTLDRQALAAALAGLADSHPALGAGFTAGSDGPQIRRAEPCPPVPVELVALDPDDERAWSAFLDRTAWTPFDLAEPPLLRAAVVDLGPDRTRLVLTVHHLVADGFSLEVLVDEIGRRYAAHAGTASPAPVDLAASAPVVIAPRRATDRAAALDFWTERLREVPSVLDLPPVAARGVRSGRAGTGHAFSLDGELTGRAAAFARAEGTTLFAVLLAAYQTVLARWTRQYEFVVGTPVSVRGPGDAEEVGLFVETMPLVARVDRAGSFRELVRAVRKGCAEALAWPHVPLEQLLETLSVARDPDRPPLMQTLFSWQSGPAPLPDFGGAQVRSLEVTRRWAKFDLTLEARAHSDGLDLFLEYATAAVDAATVAALAEALGTLLADALADPDRPLGRLALAPAEHRSRIARWNRTDREVPDTCLPDLVEAQATATPDAVALVDGERTLTYAQLDRTSAALAARLRATGKVGPDTLVAVCLRRSAELVVALTAVLRAGGAYVPLDPDYPAARLEYMLRDSAAPVVFTTAELEPRLTGSDATVLLVDLVDLADPGPGEAAPTPPTRGTTPDDLAYVIYTSGSTGRPKGAMNTHRAVVNRLLWMRDAYAVGPHDRVLQKTSSSFDVSVWELFLPLISGGRLVLAEPGGERDPRYLAELIVRESVTMAHFVPSMFAAFLDEPRIASCTSLRTVVCSGEALGADLARKARDLLKKAELHNLYGPTEAAVDVTAWNCAAEPDRPLVPIGRPIWNTRLHVLDEDARPVPVGFPGELHLAGVQVGRGYLGRPELTDERFPTDPLGDGSELRCYRTGDLVRWTADGVLDFLGRIDGQVKVRGFRIEPGEIEAVLAEHPGVRSAAVLATEQRLVAYVVATSSAHRPGADELRAHAAAFLPAHCVPAAFVALPALPLTPNGKLDRQALAKAETPETALGGTPARTATEALVAAAWAEALGRDAVGVEDDFFAVGGDSIRSLRVVGRLRQAGHELSVRDFYTARTVAAQAALLTGHGSAPAIQGAAPAPFALLSDADRALVPSGVEDAFPLSALQAAMLYASQKRLGSAVYHDVLSLRLRTRWDAERFADTVRRAARSHPALRTSFDVAGFSEPLQLIHTDVEIPLEVHDWRELTEAKQNARLRDWLDAERARRIEPEIAPLIRLFVHRRSEDVIQLTVSFHHAILDGWSLASLVTGLLTDDVEAPAGSGSFSYAAFVAQERRAVADPQSLAFWQALLDGADLSPLPRWDPPRRGSAGERIVRRALEIPAAVAEELQALARDAEVPLKSVLVEVHATVLGLLTGSQDVTTGLVSHARPELPGADRLLGLYLTPVPLRRRLTGTRWPQRVRAAFEAEREVLAHRRYPAARLRADRGGELFESLVNFNHFHTYDEAQRSGAFELLAVEEAWEETDLALVANFVRTSDAGLRLDLTLDAEIFGTRQTDAMAALYLRVLTAMAARTDTAIPDAVLAGAEREQVLAGWGSNDRPWPSDTNIVALVDRQAQERPDEPAADYPDGRLSYRELVARADRWAARLVTAGVRPGDRVAVLHEASAELITLLLGILRTGAAYVPLDPEHPASRWQAVLADAAPAVIVAQPEPAQRLSTVQDSDVPIILVGDSAEEQATPSADAPPPVTLPPVPPDPDAIAYVCYTSGSTGRPKGVAVPHRGVVRLVRGADYLQIQPGDRVGQAATFAFDAATFEVWGALANGGTVVGIERPALLDPDALADTLAGRGIDVLFLTTAVVHATVRRRRDAFATLRVLLFGGEHADPGTIRALLETAPPHRLLHVYGPTETTTFATWYEVGSVARGAGCVPIGRPVANTDVVVVDGHGRPLPPGAPGELLIGGPGVAAGYLGRPDATAEVFVPHPLDPGRLAYRTGDIVRWNPEGQLEFVGRRDAQVKIRGFRVEPAEVETVLAGLPGVDEAVVAVRTGPDGTPVLVGYVRGTGLDPVALTALASRELPRPMVPAALVVLDAFPLNANGKVDRRALPEPDLAARARQRVAPESEDERRVAEIWAAMLRLSELGVTDDFFDVGGHSLLLAQLAGRLEAEWGVRLPLETLLAHPTVRGQAAELRRLNGSPSGRPQVRGIVELRGGDPDLPPLVLVHAVGGSCATYTSLARALPDGRRVLGLQAPGLDGGEPLDSVVALAEHHRATLRAAGVGGPLLLGGMSMGGTIAFEMARQLADAGRSAALVALLDSPGPGQMPRRFTDDAEVLAAAFGPEGDGAELAARLRALRPTEMMRHVLAEAQAGGTVPGDFELVDLEHFLAIWKAHTTALYGYVPGPYDGAVHYFRAQDTVPPHPAHPERPWQTLLGRALEVFPVPGDHQSMVEPPHVATLAALLSRSLTRAVQA